ncbi:MAG: penicillin-binding protein 2 [Candidatus Theseobacter exili]|nr:penicillin-binding protein 2 [Candidatus Theseobacter exili]
MSGVGGRLRSIFIALITISAFSFLMWRLYWLQVEKHDFFLGKAKKQHHISQKVFPHRGKILDRNGRDLAISVPVQSIYGVPGEVDDIDETVQVLSELLNLKPQRIRERLLRKKHFVWIKRKVSEAASNKIKELKLSGIHLLEEIKREYPGGELLCHLLGFVNIDNEGLEGLELTFNKQLRGKPGWRKSERDATGREIPFLRIEDVPANDGSDIVLTIDMAIQTIAETELNEAVISRNAIGGSVIVLDPGSGEVLAMANMPKYNTNKPTSVPQSHRRNRAVTDMFEPGSTFKPISISIALNENIINLNDRFYCENGAFRYAGHTLHDSHSNKVLTVKEIIEQSSNIGAAKIGLKMGRERFFAGIKGFGCGEKTGIQLPGEIRGVIREPSKWSKLSIICLPMGQEISVTALQLICAYGALANGGILYKPYVIDKIRGDKGNVIWEAHPQRVRRVISENASSEITKAMKGVVSLHGTASRAIITGYSVAGKTGTAQKVAIEGGYSHELYVSSFIGYFPADNPRLVIAVVLDEPKPDYYGGVVAAPVFKSIAKKILHYLEIPPDIDVSE